MTSLSLADMYIQFRTLTFHSRSKEQLQECLHLKKFVNLLSATIGALSSPLQPHSESDLTTYLYSGSTPIAIMDESDCRISFNCLKKSATSLPAMIEAFGSPLEPHSKSDQAIDLYSGSTPIAIVVESDRQTSFNSFKETRDLPLSGDRGIGLSFITPSRK
jgi:hypothetical protein